MNPLLRFDGFAPRAKGIQAMLPHVDALRAGHNIAALQDLADAISDRNDVGILDQISQMPEPEPKPAIIAGSTKILSSARDIGARLVAGARPKRG